MKITEILRPQCVRVPLTATDKTAAITELVDLLNEQGLLGDRDAVLGAVLAREETRSTGIGLGLAVPHGKSHGLDMLSMAIGKPQTPIEFDSIDGRPCSLIVLLASPVDKTGPHIHALAGVSRLWQAEGFRAAMAGVSSSEELYQLIKEYEA